jgi:hypothetical protein
MTAPLLDLPVRVREAAAWDLALLGGAVGTLTGVADRLPSWRIRLEGVARAVDVGESWAGPAAAGAAGALRDLSAAGWAVARALSDSLAAFERLAAEADRAQDLARAALARADALPPTAGASLPLTTVAAALDHAAAVTAAAHAAGEALAGVGVRDASAPADFSALTRWVPVASPVCAPPGPAGPPEAVAAWWAGLPLTAQLAALQADPSGLGGRDGLPAWSRDRANRLLLAHALADPATDRGEAAAARVVARRIAAEEAAGRQVQLHLLDLPADRVALGLGDLDTADAVALLVPGINTTPADDLDRLTGSARAVADATAEAAPALTLATMVWLGYDSPSGIGQVLGRRNAVEGGPVLARTLTGLLAGREAVAAADARITVLAHSYGTVVVDEAADVAGELDADALVLLGSPGMEEDADSLEVPEVYDAASPDDLVAVSRWFGGSTASDRFGSTGLPVDPGTGHSEYYDRDLPTLTAIGWVVAGVPDPR